MGLTEVWENACKWIQVDKILGSNLQFRHVTVNLFV